MVDEVNHFDENTNSLFKCEMKMKMKINGETTKLFEHNKLYAQHVVGKYFNIIICIMKAIWFDYN